VAPVLAPEPPLAAMPEVLADVSMKEEEELCQAFSDALLTVEDIDEQDGDMPQLCCEYVKDIYSYLSALEVMCTSKVDASSYFVFNFVFIQPIFIFFPHRNNKVCDPSTCKAMKSMRE